MKVYLAVPIIANRQLEKAKTIGRVIQSLGYELISTWVTNENPGFSFPASYVFERDLRGVKNCDVIVAEVSRGSHGVGMEVMAAYLCRKQIIFIQEQNAKVSHMLLGVPDALLLTYDSIEDIEEKLTTALRQISNRIQQNHG